MHTASRLDRSAGSVADSVACARTGCGLAPAHLGELQLEVLWRVARQKVLHCRMAEGGRQAAVAGQACGSTQDFRKL